MQPQALYPERKPDSRTEVSDLQMEVRALEYERANVAAWLHQIGNRIESALLPREGPRVDVIEDAANELRYYAGRLTRQGEAS